MVRKCPPGVLCFENITLVIIAIIVIGIAIYAHSRFFGHHGHHANPIIMMSREQQQYPDEALDFGIGGPSSNQDVLLNPYVPPLRYNSGG